MSPPKSNGALAATSVAPGVSPPAVSVPSPPQAPKVTVSANTDNKEAKRDLLTTILLENMDVQVG